MATGSKIRAGAAFVELKSKDADFIRGMEKARRQLESFGAAARNIGTKLLAGGGGIVAAGAIASRVFAKVGDDLDKMSKRTGIAVESLSAFTFAAEQSGASLQTFERGIQGMQRALFDASRGLATQIDTLERLGLTYDQLKNLSPEQQFITLADRLSKVSDMTTRAGIAMQIFGRAGRQLLPLFENGAAGLKEFRDQAEKLGLIFSTKSASAAAELTDTLNIANRVIRALVFEIGGALAPVVTRIAKAVTLAAAAATKWVRQNRELVVVVAGVGAALVVTGATIIGVGLAAGLAAFAVGGLTTAIGFMGAVVGIAGSVLAALLSPIGLIGAAVVGLGAIVVTQSDTVRGVAAVLLEVFKTMASDVFSVISSITDALLAGDLKLAVEIAGTAMQIAWRTATGGMLSRWYDIQGKIAKGFVDLGIVGGGLDGDAIKQGIDEETNRKKNVLTDELRNLTEQLKNLQSKSPDGVFKGLGSVDFSTLLQGIQANAGGGGPSRTASGIFATNAIGTLATAEEKDIQANTKTIVDQMNQALELFRNSEGGLVVQ